MITTYRVHFINGENETFKCSVFQLKKKVSEKFNNIPIDQIVLIDKNNKLHDFNKALPTTQILNPNIEQIYRLVDLQKLIMEWSQIKIDNGYYQEKIVQLQNYINELKNQIERHNQEQQKNLTENLIYNNEIIQLREDLEKQTQYYSQERQQLQDRIQDLRFQITQDTNKFDQAKQLQGFQLLDLKEKLKAAEDKIQNKDAYIQQLSNQIQERDKLIENITYQIQQYMYQISQQWQYCNYYQQQIAIQKQLFTEEKGSLDKLIRAEETKNQIITQEKNELKIQLGQAHTQNQTQEAMIQKFQQQIENIRQAQENLELEKNKVEKAGWQVNNEVQKLNNELSKQKNDFINLQSQKDEIKNELDNLKQIHALFVQQQQVTLQTAKQKQEEQDKNKINQLNIDINNLKNQISDANYTIQSREAQIEYAQQELQKLQLQLDQQISNCKEEKRTLEQTIRNQQNELDKARQLYEAEKAKYRTAENEITQLKGDLLQKDIELTSEKTNQEATKREKNQYQDQCKKMADSFQELSRQTTNEVERLTTQAAMIEKITGPLEKIIASEFKINRFTEDPKSKLDNAQYNLIEITLQQDKYTKYVKEGKFFLIDECFQYGNKINITATRSIQANAESEFYKGYLIKIIESPQADLKTKTLLRKDLKLQNLAFQNKEEAARLAVNNIFCQWLQMQFDKDLVTAKLQSLKQTIQRQFIIENEAKKEFYYCEMVEEGPFQKINGGKFVPQKDDIHQYFNALSSYSFKMFQQQMILTNFQVCGNYIYDMIVHTNHKGLFSPLDQGSHESITFTEILSEQPADIMSKSWNDTVKSLAENYLR